MIWTDETLLQLSDDAAKRIATEQKCVYSRFYQAVTAGEPILTVPSFVLGLMRVCWRGIKLDPVNWQDMEALSLTQAAISNTDFVNGSTGRPLWYAQSPTNVRDIRIYPTPQESFNATGDPYSPTPNEDKLSIACYRFVDDTDNTLTLPPYIDRRTRKAYVLWKAFEMEGKGQNLNASNYYKEKFEFLMAQFARINSGVYVSKRYGLTERMPFNRRKYPRPMLPSNFERVDLH